MQHIFILGSKGIPAAYGGYETFVHKLTEYHNNRNDIKYHVACKSNDNGEFEYNNARCFKIKVPNLGAAQAIYYDIKALSQCCKYIKKNNIKNPIVYILACRIGPFISHYEKKIHKFCGKLYINPDGHEWMRAKWPLPVKRYWKISERLMTKHCDMIICDSKNIEKYINKSYIKYKPKTMYISYGAETRSSNLDDKDDTLINWYDENNIEKKKYYLVVGRFVPENNYETMIREFMLSTTKKDFVIITNVSDKFLAQLKLRTGFDNDKRIKFVGTVYNQELLLKIRENAYGYFHGHEVGGTNPSLLEALGSTDLNLLLDVGFNREVANDGALYWNKDKGNLAKLIEKADDMSSEEIHNLGVKAHKRISEYYSWDYIANEYANLWLK